MKIRKTPFDNIEGELDARKVELHSVKNNQVVLPYTGELPKGVEGRNPRIFFNIQAFQRPMALLLLNDGKEVEDKFALDISDEEILEIFGKLFNESHNIGLSHFWYGIWQTNFFDWRKSRDYHRLLMAIEELPAEKRADLMKDIRRYNEAAAD